MKSSKEPDVVGEDLDPKKQYTIIGKLISHKLLPVYIGERLVVVPKESGYQGSSDEIVLRMNQDKTDAFITKEGVAVNFDGERPDSAQANAFGSGTHPTTQMALSILGETICQDDTVIDLGTGTGVLSIYAAKLGAGSVLGVDVDEVAIEIARDNIKMNGVESIVSVETGSLDVVKNRYNSRNLPCDLADILVVNLITRIILELLDDNLTSVIKTKGTMILTGIQLEEYEKVREKLDRLGHSIIERREQGDWCAVVVKPMDEEEP